MIPAFQNAVSYLCFAVLAVIACVCLFAGFRQVGMWLRANLRPISLVVFAAAAVIATCEAQKRGGEGGSGTSAQPIVQSIPGAETNAKWRAHGAFEDVFYLPASNWWARMPGGGWVDHLRIRSSGGFQVKGASGGSWTNYPPPFAQKLSLAPEANWSLPSLFWHAATPSNTLVMTWLGGLYARSHTNQVDFQAELFNDGSYDYRYADHTEHFAASLPFDLDGDGLENSVDPDPLTPGSNAHGTNAEWYNTVCSNVFASVEGGGTGTTGILPVDDVSVLPWREGVNSNAYYFVDVVTERGPAPIYFTGDRDSRLGNPVVVTLAGVTNRVPLLIGIDYAVTSDTPFSVSFPVDYMYPTVTTNGVANYNVRWPLNFVFTEEIGASNRVYTVTVEPYDPGGVLEWDDSGGGVPMRGGTSGGGCNCVSYGVNSVWFTCSSGTCESGCVAHGSYLLERTSFSVEGGECRCGFDDPPPDVQTSSHDPDDPPSLTITFSKPAVIFEDSFLERPGMTRPRRSTRVRLTIDAYGGSGGGALTLSGVNMDKLVAVNGNVTLPYNDVLAPGATYHVAGVYEGVNESDEENDVVVQGNLVPNYPYNVPSPQARLTAAKVALEAEFTARDNPCQSRHTYGVGERVKFNVTPALSTVELKVIKSDNGGKSVYDTFENEFTVDASTQRIYTCPIVSITPDITVSCAGSRYRPMMKIVEPSHVVTQSAEFDGVCWPMGECGEAGLQTVNYIAPFYVSFQGVAVSEVPCNEAIPPTGYFTNLTSHLTHGTTEGAGRAMWIKPNNYWTTDNAFTTSFIPNWSPGTLIWKIPIGWHRKQLSGNGWHSVGEPDYEINTNRISRALLIGGRTDAYLQKRTIQEDGTFVTEKFGYWISRTRWCHIMLGRDGEEGETVQWFHLFD